MAETESDMLPCIDGPWHGREMSARTVQIVVPSVRAPADDAFGAADHPPEPVPFARGSYQRQSIHFRGGVVRWFAWTEVETPVAAEAAMRRLVELAACGPLARVRAVEEGAAAMRERAAERIDRRAADDRREGLMDDAYRFETLAAEVRELKLR